MGAIVLVGGGDHENGETLAIDKKIIELSGKENPKLLYISTASDSEPQYSEQMTSYFTSLGTKTEKLSLILDNYSAEEIRNKILSSDIIYVGGGDTIRLVYFWKALGVDKYLAEAYEKGIVLSGVSAGSQCWCNFGHTDSLSYYIRDWDFTRFPCLGFVPAVVSPHFSEKRRQSLTKWLENGETETCVALENGTALIYADNKASIVRGIPEANAHIYYPLGGGKYKEIIPRDGEFFSLDKNLL